MRKQYINYPSNLPVNISYYNIHNYPTHWHNSTEIIYVLEGSINISIDTDSFTLKENEVEIINPDECHSFSSENDNKVLIFQIDPDFFEKYYKDIRNVFFYTNSNDEEDQNGEKYDELKSLLCKILCEFVQTLEDFDEQIEDILINLLYHLINNFHYLTTDKEELKEKSEQLDRYHRISKYIFNNYNNNITLQEIAKKEFLSPHYLSHEIKYATGHSFTDLINLTRIEESIKLLLDTTMSITEISEKIGFSHVRYYNKNFKSYFGCTPLQYRKKYYLNENDFDKSKNVTSLDLNGALNLLSYNLENYDRFNFENKLWNIHINMDESLNNLEEVQEEIHFTYGRLEKMFHNDMGVFIDSDFYNWNRAKAVLEFLYDIDIKPLIVIDNTAFTTEKYTNVLKSFIEYFSALDFSPIEDLKFQFSSTISKEIKNYLLDFLNNEFSFEVLQDDFVIENTLNQIYDTSYMLPYIIHNTILKKDNLSFLRNFDVLEKATNITNEVFIGAPGIVNDMGIRKPSYYAFYLLSKLANEIVSIDDGCIVTKSDDLYAILLYCHNNDMDSLAKYESIYKNGILKKSFKKKYSLNIANLKSATRIITYTIDESTGSSYNYWLSMGSPKRLNKEEKEILHKASYPKIEFKYSIKNSVLNIITELNGYGAKLIILRNIKQ